MIASSFAVHRVLHLAGTAGKGDEYADAVRADEAEAQHLGVTGVPFTVLDERLAIPGSTSVEGFAAAIERACCDVTTDECVVVEPDVDAVPATPPPEQSPPSR